MGIRLFRRSWGRRGRRRVVLMLCAQGHRREPQNEGNQEREANTAVSHLLLSVLRTRRTAHSIPMQEPVAETRSSRVAGEDLEPENRPEWRRAGGERRPPTGQALRSRRGESGGGRGRKRERRGRGDDQGGPRRKPYGILAVRRSAGAWGRRGAAGVLLAMSLRRRGPGSAFELAEAAERRQRRKKDRSECRSRYGYRSFHSNPCRRVLRLDWRRSAFPRRFVVMSLRRLPAGFEQSLFLSVQRRQVP